MIPTMSLVFGGAPATAGIPALGLEPVLWLVTALVATAAARIAHAAWRGAPPAPPRPKRTPQLRVLRPLNVLAQAGKAS